MAFAAASVASLFRPAGSSLDLGGDDTSIRVERFAAILNFPTNCGDSVASVVPQARALIAGKTGV
jgi:hypothetical protein